MEALATQPVVRRTERWGDRSAFLAVVLCIPQVGIVVQRAGASGQERSGEKATGDRTQGTNVRPGAVGFADLEGVWRTEPLEAEGSAAPRGMVRGMAGDPLPHPLLALTFHSDQWLN